MPHLFRAIAEMWATVTNPTPPVLSQEHVALVEEAKASSDRVRRSSFELLSAMDELFPNKHRDIRKDHSEG